MSDRSSFVSEYIYDRDDYYKVLQHLQSLDIFNRGDAVSWVIGSDFIISGKIRITDGGNEYWRFAFDLGGLKTTYYISFILIAECGDIYHIIKNPDGRVFKRHVAEWSSDMIIAPDEYECIV